ncbi:hypothetical protein [Zunongwangia sp. HGR-M22]|uniref:hypothetical protein n=1 Tax=Zunongwangia sp. HGR-M22 TaxID=3015168 RepID=UPI0022DD6FB6|nr:hypothetical protein [Zunongwangia sp. HGR-M22]WBL26683.1 hypothetical protein PBT91_05285 [Zunongwangia sp. HGR-M22]
MLDLLIVKKLTRKGKTAYWIIQLTLDILFIGYLFLFMDYDMDRLTGDGYGILIVGIVVSLLISAGICLSLWKKPKEESNTEED